MNKEIKKKQKELIAERKDFLTPELLKEAEEFHRKLSYLSPEDLSRQFTI